MSALQPIYNLPIRYKQGGEITRASNTTLTVAPLLARSAADDFDINVGDYLGTPVNTTVNGATVGLNGLDTGTLGASKVYAVWAIADQAGYNPSGILLSLSATNPIMPSGVFPSGYNTKVRFGWAVTNASSQFVILKMSGFGATVEYSYDVPVTVLTAGTSATQAAVDLSSGVPAIGGITVNLGCNLVGNAAGDTAKLCYSGGTIASSGNVITAQRAGSITQNIEMPSAIVSLVPKVDYILSTASANLTLVVNGFTDRLL